MTYLTNLNEQAKSFLKQYIELQYDIKKAAAEKAAAEKAAAEKKAKEEAAKAAATNNSDAKATTEQKGSTTLSEDKQKENEKHQIYLKAIAELNNILNKAITFKGNLYVIKHHKTIGYTIYTTAFNSVGTRNDILYTDPIDIRLNGGYTLEFSGGKFISLWLGDRDTFIRNAWD